MAGAEHTRSHFQKSQPRLLSRSFFGDFLGGSDGCYCCHCSHHKKKMITRRGTAHQHQHIHTHTSTPTHTHLLSKQRYPAPETLLAPHHALRAGPVGAGPDLAGLVEGLGDVVHHHLQGCHQKALCFRRQGCPDGVERGRAVTGRKRKEAFELYHVWYVRYRTLMEMKMGVYGIRLCLVCTTKCTIENEKRRV